MVITMTEGLVCPLLSMGSALPRNCIRSRCAAWVPEKVVPTLYKKDGSRTIAAYCKLMEAHECNME
jgi:hypothetical protein